MASYLVTGGCGFIGSHLVAALCQEGHAVRVLDDLSTGRSDNLPPGVLLLLGDVANRRTVRQAMEGVDGCFHLAAIASVERGTRNMAGTHRVNLSGTVNVLEAAAKLGRIPVVYASSAAVYGDCDLLPLTEDAPTRPVSTYGADKLGCEQHARGAGLVHGVPSFGLRFFNVFGPGQDPRSPYSGVVSIFCRRLSCGDPVTVYGDGTQTRDFVGVDHVTLALRSAMARAAVAAPVANVCTGRPTSVLELAETIAALCGSEASIVHAPARSGEIRHSIGAPERAMALLGLPPPQDLHHGLHRLLVWSKDQAKAAQRRPRPAASVPA